MDWLGVLDLADQGIGPAAVDGFDTMRIWSFLDAQAVIQERLEGEDEVWLGHRRKLKVKGVKVKRKTMRARGLSVYAAGFGRIVMSIRGEVYGVAWAVPGVAWAFPGDPWKAPGVAWTNPGVAWAGHAVAWAFQSVAWAAPAVAGTFQGSRYIAQNQPKSLESGLSSVKNAG